MCGIVGAVRVRLDAAAIDARAVEASTRLLGHRGPDAEGIAHDPEFSFGHRRLTVIDPDPAANQPMTDAAGDVFLTYNGEVYNFPELRDELRALGHAFRTASDTEVVLHAWLRWGASCVERFLGMFAFGLYDRRTHTFFLARDRLGVKPLYLCERDGVLLFASEVKALLAYPGVPRTLNLAAVSNFLSYRHVLGTETLFSGLEQLPPAHLLEARGGRITRRRYWEIDLTRQPRPATGEDRERLKALIGDAVRRRMLSDVPVGAFLSGGLDSSIIVREMARGGGPVTTFTASFAGEAYDESPYAEVVARQFGTRHHHLRLEPEHYLEHTRDLIRVKDQPLGMHNEVAMYMLARELHRHVTVVLCGEGADELFDGYGRIFRTPFERARARMLARVSGEAVKPPLDFFLDRYSYFPWEEKAALYTPEMRYAAANDEACRAVFHDRFARAGNRSYHDQIALVFETVHLPGLLQMLDATTMAVGVEARVPFVDHRLVQAAFDLPEREKLRWRTPAHFLAALPQQAARYSEVHDVTKYVLRRLYRRELPPVVLRRRKMGFPVPLTQWFDGPQRGFVRDLLLRPDARVRQVFDPPRLAEWLNAPRPPGDPAFGRKVWLVLNLELWLEAYFG